MSKSTSDHGIMSWEVVPVGGDESGWEKGDAKTDEEAMELIALVDRAAVLERLLRAGKRVRQNLSTGAEAESSRLVRGQSSSDQARVLSACPA